MVSVIIPVYNGEQHLEECLRSVVEQSYCDLEIIIIDDGSTDNSYKICEKFAVRDDRIRLIHQENSGVSVARNTGLEMATGEYIMFVDADDLLTVGAVENLASRAENCTDFIVGSYEEFRGNIRRKIIRDDMEDTLSNNNIEYLDELLNTLWAKMYRRGIIEDNKLRFSESLPYCEDHIFNLNYCKYINNLKIIKDMVYCYRLGGVASSLKYYPNMNEYLLKLLNAYHKFRLDKNGTSLFEMKNRVVSNLTACILHYIAHCSYIEAIKKTKETFLIFEPYLQEENIEETECSKEIAQSIKNRDAEKLVCQLGKKHFLRMIVRKLKYKIYAGGSLKV